MAVYVSVFIASTLIMYGYLVVRDMHRPKSNKIDKLGGVG